MFQKLLIGILMSSLLLGPSAATASSYTVLSDECDEASFVRCIHTEVVIDEDVNIGDRGIACCDRMVKKTIEVDVDHQVNLIDKYCKVTINKLTYCENCGDVWANEFLRYENWYNPHGHW